MLASSSQTALKRAHKSISRAVGEACANPQSTASSVHFAHGCFREQVRRASTATQPSSEFSASGDGGRQQRNGGLRHTPFAFQPDAGFRGGAPLTPVARFNLELSNLVDNNRIRSIFHICSRMKEQGVQPDLTTYNYLLRGCAREGRDLEARAVFEDMLAMGLYPTRNMFHFLLHTMRHLDSSHMWDVIESMRRFDITPNESTYELIILRYAEAGHIELALQFLSELGERGLSPTLKSAQSIISAACRYGFPRLALDLADAFEQTSVRRLDSGVWVNCLISCAEALYEDGVLRAWQKVVHDLKITPDEGCCIHVLHTAGRHGLSELGLDVLRVLKRMNIVWKEYHFAPVVEAFCKEGQLKEALGMLELIRSHDIIPIAETAYPIFTAIRGSSDAVDEAWGHLETLHEEGKKVDVTALNVIIQASVALNDLQRAVGTYKACEALGVSPNVDTYNLLLAGCISAAHRELGDRLLAEMKNSQVKPDARTYERLILLCLTQSTYEDAFFYLEEMKAEGHVPPVMVYEALVRKCVSVGDTRHQLAVEELVECGYQVSPALKVFIETGGEHDPARDERSPPLSLLKDRPTRVRDAKRVKFMTRNGGTGLLETVREHIP